LNGYTPFKFIKFLDQCAKLVLLKKVGGGYIFIHRILLDYFADIPTREAFRCNHRNILGASFAIEARGSNLSPEDSGYC
jgi:hypothetical protein